MLKRVLLSIDTGFLRALGALGLLGLVIPRLQTLRFLLLLFLVAPAFGWWQRRARLSSRGDDNAPSPPRARFPNPLPAARYPSAAMAARYYGSVALALLNPLQLGQMLLQVVGLVVIAARYRGALPGHGSYRLKGRYTLPVRGTWRVMNGGPDQVTSHSWEILTQRYAYDIVKTDDGLARHHEGTEGRRLTDYLCYGEPIVAAADGVVESVRDGVRDHPEPGTLAVDWRARDFRGNHIVIRHADGEYGFYAHLVPGTIRSKRGDRVMRGEEVGRCGNSGHSTEPHLHFHLQDRASFWFAAGLPILFDEISIDGEPASAPVAPQPGNAVSPSSSTNSRAT